MSLLRPILRYALALVLVASTTPAWSVNYTANVAYDALDADANDCICDVDLATPNVDPDPDPEMTCDEIGQCSLRAAIMLANETPEADGVLLDLDRSISGPAVTYALTLAGAGEDAAASGDLDITTPISIASEGQSGGVDNTFIDGKKLKDRIFDVRAGGNLTLQRLSLLNGKTAKDDADPSGGCLRSVGLVTLNTVFFTRCSASGNGGAVSVSGGTFTATNVAYTLGKAKAEGGGIALTAAGTATLLRNTFGKNRAATGGAIATRGALTLRHGTADGNRAKLGGGIAVLGAGATTITHTTLSENGKVNLDASQNTGTLLVGGTLVWDGAPDCVGTVPSGGGNLESGSSCNFVGATDQHDVVVDEPLLAPLNDYGGLVPVRALARYVGTDPQGDRIDNPALDRGLDDAGACELDARLVYRARIVPEIPGSTSTADVGATDYDTRAAFDLEITSDPITTATVGVEYTYDVEAVNPQRPACITFSLADPPGPPAGMTIDAVTGLISWTPAPEQEGSAAVTVNTNSNGATFDAQSFLITVAPAP